MGSSIVIKGITGNNGITVQYNGGSPYVNMNNASAGMVRYNGNSSSLEVYDGSSWLQLDTSYPTIGLDGNIMSAIEWARKKRDEEEELLRLCKEHPGLQEAYERLQIMKALILEEKKNA